MSGVAAAGLPGQQRPARMKLQVGRLALGVEARAQGPDGPLAIEMVVSTSTHLESSRGVAVLASDQCAGPRDETPGVHERRVHFQLRSGQHSPAFPRAWIKGSHERHLQTQFACLILPSLCSRQLPSTIHALPAPPAIAITSANVPL